MDLLSNQPGIRKNMHKFNIEDLYDSFFAIDNAHRFLVVFRKKQSNVNHENGKFDFFSNKRV